MNGTDSPLSSHPAASSADLQQQVDALRLWLAVSLGLTMIVGLSMGFYLYGQNRILQASLRESEPMLRESEASIKEYNEKTIPRIQEFQAALQTYAATHPDIAPILQKYKMTNQKPVAPPAAPKK